MAALTVAGGVAKHIGDAKYAKEASRAIADSTNASDAALREQRSQLEARAIDQAQARKRDGMIERGRLESLLGEGGGMGRTIDRILNENAYNTGTDIASIETNRVAAGRQNERDRDSNYARGRSEIASIRKPSLLETGLGIVGGLGSLAIAGRR